MRARLWNRVRLIRSWANPRIRIPGRCSRRARVLARSSSRLPKPSPVHRAPGSDAMAIVPQSSPEPLLRAVELRKSYVRRGFWTAKTRNFKALDGVSLRIHRGSCTALIGESGSGKSTLASCLVRLEEADEGEVWFEGTNISRLSGQALRSARARFQLIFQDAYSALNPVFTATELVEEPLAVQKIGTKLERRDRAREMLRRLGIPEDRHKCRPQEFSGGQR